MSDVRLHLGDCLEVMRTMADSAVDAVVTDPPYSSGGQFRGDRMGTTRKKYQNSGTVKLYPEFTGDNRDQRSFGYWSTLWVSECLRITKPGGVCLLFSDWRQLPSVTDVIQSGGWVWRGIAVWDKTEAARPAKGRFRNQCEFVAWGSKGSMPTVGKCLPGVWRKAISSKAKHHTTAKPVEVMTGLLEICPPGGTVLDPFMGSGTTGVAAAQLGLSFIGIESDPGYYAIADRRIAAAKADAASRFAFA